MIPRKPYDPSIRVDNARSQDKGMNETNETEEAATLASLAAVTPKQAN